MKTKFIKKIVASIFAVALFVIGVCCFDTSSSKVQAADGVNGKVVAEYKNAGTHPEEDGMIFAGWYTDEEHTTALTGTPAESTTYYAKFVPEEVLSVKFQFSTDGQKLRFISSVDNFDYSSVGFELTVNGGNYEGEYINTNTEVFKRITAAEGNEANAYKYSPKVVDTASEYMITATWPNVESDASYMVTPYWVTLDGTTVYGVSRTVSVADRQKVNVTMEVSEELTVGTTLLAAYGTKSGIEAEVIGYDAPYAHVKINTTAADLSSATTFEVSKTDGTKLGTVVYRNLATKYTGENADTSWYTEYKDETEFVIATSADLYGLSKLVYDGTVVENFENKTVYLVSDITVNEGEAKVSSWIPAVVDGATAPIYDWYPIGRQFSGDAAVETSEYPFKGTFDGQEHTISGIYLDNSGSEGTGWTSSNMYAGLFGYTEDSTVKNFRITNSYYYSTFHSVGSISGGGDGTFENIYSDVNIYSTTNIVGGLVARVCDSAVPSTTKLAITNCWYAGTITNTYTNTPYIGGFIGFVVFGCDSEADTYNNVIQDSLFTGTINYVGPNSGNVRVGGLVGASNGGTNSEIQILNTLCAGKMISSKTNVKQAGTVIGKVGTTESDCLENVYVTLKSSNTMNAVGDHAEYTVGGAATLSADALNGNNGTRWTTVNGQVVLSSFADIEVKVEEDAEGDTEEETKIPAKQKATVTQIVPQILPVFDVPNMEPDEDGYYYVANYNYTGYQGGCFDGRYYYQAFLKYCYYDTATQTRLPYHEKNLVIITKYDVLLQKVVQTSPMIELQKANDMTYNSKLNRLVVSYSYSSNLNKVAFINPDTLEVERTQSINYNVYGIDYNEKTDQYVIATSNVTFRIANGDLTSFSRSYTGAYESQAYTSQGLCCDNDYIYWVYYGNGTNKLDGTTLTTDAIFMYDWEGNFVSKIECDLGSAEPENISVVNGTLYVGTAGLYEVGDLLPAE